MDGTVSDMSAVPMLVWLSSILWGRTMFLEEHQYRYGRITHALVYPTVALKLF